MNTRHFSRWFWMALAVVFLTVPFVANKTAANKPAQPQNGRATANLKTAGGLTVVTFTTNPGTIRLNLPDDMRAGDTISGTVIAEPNGQTPEERATNQAKLRDHVVRLTALDPNPPTPRLPIILDLSKDLDQSGLLGIVTATFTAPEKVKVELYVEITGVSPPINNSQIQLRCMNQSCSPISEVVFDIPSVDAIKLDPPLPQHVFAPDLDNRKISTNPKTIPATPPSGAVTPIFIIPYLGQTGRPIAITGPFDGDSSNTTLNGTALRSLVQDFEKNTENVSGGFGLLAESPRKAVFQAPANVTGPIELNLKERDVETKGTYRNVGVNLTAPKTSLLKGESTTLKVEVSGLQGITQPVPLTLECKGVITMEGGIYQPLMIQPSQVGADGRYSTTRGITGVQAGGWGATATVVTNRFNVCLQDDSVPGRRVLWNTFTGDYIFTNIFPPPTKPRDGTVDGGTVQTGGTQTGDTGAAKPTDVVTPNPPGGLTGTGKMKMKGCIITLTHNAPDRRVMSRLDTCNKTGDASVQTTLPKTNLTITDKDITDSTLPSK